MGIAYIKMSLFRLFYTYGVCIKRLDFGTIIFKLSRLVSILGGKIKTILRKNSYKLV